MADETRRFGAARRAWRASGVRDDNMLESALMRPENLLAYGNPDLADLGAAYAFGLGRSF